MGSDWEQKDEARRYEQEAADEARDAERGDEPLLHDLPHYNFRTGEYRFPCGLDGETRTARVAYDYHRVNCQGCLSARADKWRLMRESTARNAAWLAAQPFGTGHRFEVVNGELVDTYGEGVKS